MNEESVDNKSTCYAFSKEQTLWILFAQFLGLVILFATAPKPAQVIGQTLVPGNLPLQLWGGFMGGEGLANSPTWVQNFLYFLLAMALVSIVFMPRRLEARWAGGGLLAGVFNTFWVIPYLPIVSLGGMYAVMHFVLWIPGYYLLLRNRPFMKGWSVYGIWCGLVTGIITFSFVFDVRDTSIYVSYVWNLPG